MSQQLVLDARLQSMKDWAFWLYIFHAISLLLSFGLFSWIPLIISYFKRGDAAGTFVYSHHNWQIRSFWWYLLWLAIGWICVYSIIGIIIGIPVLVLAWLWKAYRLLKGALALNDNQPMPA
jgi:uncharacterized membrane protein